MRVNENLNKNIYTDLELDETNTNQWQELISRSIENSAITSHTRRLSHSDFLRYEEEQLLKCYPFTGICTGLALEFIINFLRNPDTIPEMKPTVLSKYFQRMLLPVIVNVAKEHSISPKMITVNQGSVDVYHSLARRVSSKTNLTPQISSEYLHLELDTLPKALIGISQEEKGHTLLILEKCESPILNNHTIYFNPQKRLIADGRKGNVIEVPQETDFNAFFHYYLSEKYDIKEGLYSHFSLIAIETSEEHPRVPNLLDQAELFQEFEQLKSDQVARHFFSRKLCASPLRSCS